MCGAGEVNGLIEGNITQNSREGSSNPPVVAAIDYVVEIHPPIVIENLLPHRGIFEIMHADDADTFGENQMNSGVSESSRGVGGSGGPRTGSGSDRGGSMASSVDWASGMVGGLLQGSQTAGHKRMLWCAELKHGETPPTFQSPSEGLASLGLWWHSPTGPTQMPAPPACTSPIPRLSPTKALPCICSPMACERKA